MKTDKKSAAWRSVAIVAFVLCVAFAWIAFDTLAGICERGVRQIAVPHCTGRALSALSLGEEFDVHVEYRYDDAHAAGTVIAQSPAGGAKRTLSAKMPTCALRLTVSKGTARAMVPDFVGRDAREAEVHLRALGFRVYRVEKRTDAPAGRVLLMHPCAGVTLNVGEAVTLTVSTGLPAQTVTVPDLTGLSRADALMQVYLSHLRVGEVVDVQSDAAAGTVVRQSHLAGTTVVSNTRITLYVSASNQNFE